MGLLSCSTRDQLAEGRGKLKHLHGMFFLLSSMVRALSGSSAETESEALTSFTLPFSLFVSTHSRRSLLLSIHVHTIVC
jgi:hypothetical protein